MNVYELASLLNYELQKDEIFLLVKENERIMEHDEEFIKLYVAYEALVNEINELNRFSADSSTLQKTLFEVKLKLDELESSSNYRKSYLKCKEYLKEITSLIIEGLDEEIKVGL